MRKIVFKALAFSMALAFIGCNNEDENSAPFFQIDATSVNVRESGLFNREIPLATNIKKFAITVAETGKDESGEYWCSAEVKDNLLVITCKENKIYDPRETDITVKPEGAQPVQVHVRQLGQAAIILVDSETNYALSILSQPIEVDIVSNVDYDIVTPEWIKEQPSSKAAETVTNTFKFDVEANQDSEERIDTIYFKQKDIEDEKAKVAMVIVKQNANIPPPTIKNLQSKSSVNAEGVASITVFWDAFPEGSNVKAVKVSYVDPAPKLRNSDNVITEMLEPDVTSYTLSGTKEQYGAYAFSIQAISLLDDEGEIEEKNIISNPDPSEVVNETKLNLVGQPMDSNAQEPSEGPIENLVDGDYSNHFHSQWSGTVPPAPHWAQIKLGTTLSKHFKIKTTPRNNKSNFPVDFDLMGSKDGTNWFLIKKFNKADDNIPTSGAESFVSGVFKIHEPFDYIRISVNETNTGSVFWTMSEFEIWDIETVADSK